MDSLRSMFWTGGDGLDSDRSFSAINSLDVFISIKVKKFEPLKLPILNGPNPDYFIPFSHNHWTREEPSSKSLNILKEHTLTIYHYRLWWGGKIDQCMEDAPAHNSSRPDPKARIRPPIL